MWRRLLSLDYVLEPPPLGWLPTEQEKVLSMEELGLDRRIFPLRRYAGKAAGKRGSGAPAVTILAEDYYRHFPRSRGAGRLAAERPRGSRGLDPGAGRLQLPVSVDASVIPSCGRRRGSNQQTRGCQGRDIEYDKALLSYPDPSWRVLATFFWPVFPSGSRLIRAPSGILPFSRERPIISVNGPQIKFHRLQSVRGTLRRNSRPVAP